jgi:hypothetical protein
VLPEKVSSKMSCELVYPAGRATLGDVVEGAVVDVGGDVVVGTESVVVEALFCVDTSVNTAMSLVTAFTA